MKTIVSLLVGFGIISPLMAVEYVTLHSAGASKTVSSGSLVEVIGHGELQESQNVHQVVTFTLVDTTTVNLNLRNVYFITGGFDSLAPPNVRRIFTGITKFELGSNYNFPVTFKFTPPEEINAVGPTSVLVIPENSTGDYDIILESSTDMTTWTPIHSQSVSSSNPTNLFRTRIVKKTAP